MKIQDGGNSWSIFCMQNMDKKFVIPILVFCDFLLEILKNSRVGPFKENLRPY
jgi:hypothetical protein